MENLNDYIQKIRAFQQELNDLWQDVLSYHPDDDMEEYDDATVEFYDAFMYVVGRIDSYARTIARQWPDDTVFVRIFSKLQDNVEKWQGKIFEADTGLTNGDVNSEQYEKAVQETLDRMFKIIDVLYNRYSEIKQPTLLSYGLRV